MMPDKNWTYITTVNALGFHAADLKINRFVCYYVSVCVCFGLQSAGPFSFCGGGGSNP